MFSLLAILPFLFPLASASDVQYAPATGYDSLLFTEDFFPLITTRLDPIVDPGKVSGHVHVIAGSNSFGANTNYASTQAGSCTTSNLKNDMSNFWAPQLYYKWKNGTYSAVMSNGVAITAYWKYPLTNTDPSQPFASIPDDFKMLAGSIKRDDFDPANASNKAIEFLCVDANGSYDYTGHIPTDRECLTLRPQLHFPECWNGVDAYKEDNSHVAYPVGDNPEGGVCPDGFFKIPHLFMETTYHVKPENIGEGYQWYPGCFVLANGDNNGYTFHADWQNGFPTGFLVDAFQQCFDASTGMIMKDCQVFAPFRGENGHDCKTEGEVVNEVIGQHIAVAALPGNNPEFNSSKHSENYPKKPDPAYTEQASLVKVSDQTGGFCIEGICSDYIGSDVAGLQQPAVPADNLSVANNGTGQTLSSAVPVISSSTTLNPAAPPVASTTAATADASIALTPSVGPSSAVSVYNSSGAPAVPSASTAMPGLALVANDGTLSDNGGSDKTCKRRRKRRMFKSSMGH
ncbi:hypothetical protein IAU59_004999 [Kwoniella sp. CBS 9459]